MTGARHGAGIAPGLASCVAGLLGIGGGRTGSGWSGGARRVNPDRRAQGAAPDGGAPDGDGGEATPAPSGAARDDDGDTMAMLCENRKAEVLDKAKQLEIEEKILFRPASWTPWDALNGTCCPDAPT